MCLHIKSFIISILSFHFISFHFISFHFISFHKDEIADRLPKVQSSGKAASPVVLKLRSLVEKVETIKAERETVESEFTFPAEDMGEEIINGAMHDFLGRMIIDKLIDIHLISFSHFIYILISTHISQCSCGRWDNNRLGRNNFEWFGHQV